MKRKKYIAAMLFVMALMLFPSLPRWSRYPKCDLRSSAAYSTPMVMQDPQQHAGIYILRDTPSNYNGRAAAVCSRCVAFAAFGYEISGPSALVPLVSPMLTAAHPWSHIHSVCILRAICNFFFKQALKCLRITLGHWCNLCQNIPWQLHSTWIQGERTVLCQNPKSFFFF